MVRPRSIPPPIARTQTPRRSIKRKKGKEITHDRAPHLPLTSQSHLELHRASTPAPPHLTDAFEQGAAVARGQFSSLSIRSGGARHRRAADLPASPELRLSASSPPLGDERLSQGAESGAAARTCRVRARVGTV